MGRDKDSRKRKHSHRSRHDSSDDSSQSDSSSDYSSTESSYESESSVEVRKKRRTSSGSRKEREKVSESKKLKRKHKTGKKEVKKKSKKKPKIAPEISKDDYYLKSAEFRTWLSKERGTYFSELSSEEARKLFSKFVVKWNKGALDKRYYEGIQSSAVAHDTQSKYKWKFASSVDSGELRTVRDSVSQWSSEGSEVRAGPSQPGPSTRGVIGPSAGPTIGPVRESVYDREERREEEAVRLKRGRKEHRKRQEVVLDELLPKATGREAKVEKKRARAEERRAREYSPDLPDRTLMGPSDHHSIQSRVRKIQDNREKKATSAAQKISDYRAKEKARMEAIMEMARANKKEGAMW